MADESYCTDRRAGWTRPVQLRRGPSDRSVRTLARVHRRAAGREEFEGDPQIGDSVRWNISPAMYGKGDHATPVLVLKPQTSGLDTNLLVTTDRRAYYLRLVSKPTEYVARVAFEYPEHDSALRWQQHLQEQRIAEKEAKAPQKLFPQSWPSKDELRLSDRWRKRAHPATPGL